jgi:hypothetical protein
MMTLFISCSPLTTATFPSLGPDCIFICNRILEETSNLYAIFPFILLAACSCKASSSKELQILFGNAHVFLAVFCFLPNVSGTGLASEDRIKTVMFSEAGGVTVGKGLCR